MKKRIYAYLITAIATSIVSLHGMEHPRIPGRRISSRDSYGSLTPSATADSTSTLRAQVAGRNAARQHYEESMASVATQPAQPYTIDLSEQLTPLIKRLMQTEQKEEKIRLLQAIKVILGNNMNQPLNKHHRTVLMLAAHHARESRHLAVLITLIDEGADETRKTTRNNGIEYYLAKHNLADAFNRLLEQHRKNKAHQETVEHKTPVDTKKNSLICVIM